jgi:hypothetical protein
MASASSRDARISPDYAGTDQEEAMTTFTYSRTAVVLSSALLLSALGYITQHESAAASNPPHHSAPASEHPPPILPLPPPRDFVRVVDNAYQPFIPGTRWRYGGETPEGQERIRVKVLERTRTIEGIEATVVRDTVRLDGEVIEDTFDWYAQDRRGNVWYLGEATKEYENGQVVSTEGSWETGVDNAHAGVVTFAHPKVGDLYRQEYYAGHAEDVAKVLTLNTQAVTEAARFTHVRMTEDTTPLHPEIAELKFYAPGVGLVLELDLSPEAGRTELLGMHSPTAS